MDTLDFELIVVLLTLLLLVCIAVGTISVIKLVTVLTLYKKLTNQPLSKTIIVKRALRYSNKTVVSALFLCTALSLFSIYQLGITITQEPYVEKTVPMNEHTLTTLDDPIQVQFNVPIDPAKLIINSHPQLNGNWSFNTYNDRLLPYTRKITFTPRESYTPDSEIIVYLSHISNPIHDGPGREYSLRFKTSPSPQIISTYPKNNEVNIPINTTITITLDKDATSFDEWYLSSDPAIAFNSPKLTGNVVTFIPTKNLEQGTTYNLELTQTPIIKNLVDNTITRKLESKSAASWQFTTVSPPFIKSFLPQGDNVVPNSIIIMQFDESMQRESVENLFSIKPATKGNLTWNEKSTSLTFTPLKPLQKETTYSVTIKQGAKSKIGGILTDDVSFSFNTIGAVRVVGTDPKDKSQNVPIDTTISITFDQEVDHDSAQQAFSITPRVDGVFSWDGNSMLFRPQTLLAYTTKYNITLNAPIKSIYGIDMKSAYSFSFTTKSKIVNLAVPLIKQEEGFTCNIAALRMLLAYRGVNLSEQQLKSLVGSNGSRGNGNPHKGFVEDYGTYWEPINTVAKKYRSTKLYTNASLSTLLTEVDKGNPVMVWAQNLWSTPTDISWTASDGTHIYAISGMHSYIIRGYTGNKDAPTSIIVNDPWRGTWSIGTNTFVRIYNYFNMAIVVY